ncbi:MAG: hypothetical protein CL847_04365 [Crocinitomicaceae bacterium]|nr:hypothetical protein [Crocinitomicaceae bacterium]|tara:strand:- start:1432 stop:2244 length:813 start_codon:yes stop_codon:yes gene_type:complete
MRIKASLLFFSLAITSVTAQKVELDSAKNDRLNTLSQEIANLTRTPLGEGDLILKQWVQYTINKKGQNRSGIIHFSKDNSTVVWLDDVNRETSFFYRETNSSPIITVSTKSNQGTELTHDMMVAMGFLKEDLKPTKYEILDEAPVLEILGRLCTGATSEITEENTDVTTFWVCKKNELRKEERRILKRAIETWCSNQTSYNRIQSAQLSEHWNILGVSEEGLEFRILDWGDEGDFVLALDQIMITKPGRDLKQIAKEHYEKNMDNSQKED